MRVTFFLEPFPIRQNPGEIGFAARFWKPLAAKLECLGAYCTFVASRPLADFEGLEAAVTPEGLGFAPHLPSSASRCDREWVQLMTDEEDPRWRPVVEALLERAAPDAVVSWAVNAPLRAACRARKIPLLQQELGPLRPPLVPLFYTDPVGVNGASAVPKVWDYVRTGPWGPRHEGELAAFRRAYAPRLPQSAALRESLRLDPRKPVYAVFTQVPRDSNVLVWSRVSGNPGLLEAVARAVEPKRAQLVLKAHPLDPGAQAAPEGFTWVGREVPAGDLIAAADAVFTINSSVGVEALLQRKPLYCFGASPWTGLGATRDVRGGADELRARLRTDALELTAEEKGTAERLLHFLLFRYFVSAPEFYDGGWLLQTLERFARLRRHDSPLEAYFPPSSTSVRLREHLAWRQTSQRDETERRLRSELALLQEQSARLEGEAQRLRAALAETTEALDGLEASAGVQAVRLLQRAPLLYPTWLAAKKALSRR